MSTTRTPKNTSQSEALVLLLNDIEADLENLRDLLGKVDTSPLGYVTADALALACWRLEYARRLAGDTDIGTSAEKRFLPSGVLRRVDGAA